MALQIPLPSFTGATQVFHARDEAENVTPIKQIMNAGPRQTEIAQLSFGFGKSRKDREIPHSSNQRLFIRPLKIGTRTRRQVSILEFTTHGPSSLLSPP